MIYFIKIKNLIKIGYSKNPMKRIKVIRDNNSDEVEILGIMKGTLSKEQELHHKFQKLHYKREWFFENNELLSFIVKNTNLAEIKFSKRKKHFGVLKNLRVSNGLTLSMMGVKMKMTSPSVFEIEKSYDNGNIRLKTLKKYLNALNYDIDIIKKPLVD